MNEKAWFGDPATATADAAPSPADETFGLGNLGAFDVPAAPEDELEELPDPGSGVDPAAGAIGATGPDPSEDVADGAGVVGIENPVVVVVVAGVVAAVTGVVVSGTVPTPPGLVTVTLAVAVALAASAFTVPHINAAAPTEPTATKLMIWRRDKTT